MNKIWAAPLAAVLLVALQGCATMLGSEQNQVRAEVQKGLQTGDFDAIVQALDATTPEISAALQAEDPAVKAIADDWAKLTPEARADKVKAYRIAHRIGEPPQPDAIFRASVNEVQARVLGTCSEKKLAVLEANPNMVVCGGRMSGLQAALTQLTIGNSYSTTPDQKFRFVIYPAGEGTKVVMSGWAETQMAFGQVNRMEYNTSDWMWAFREYLVGMGGE